MQFDTYVYPNLGYRPLTLKTQGWNRTGAALTVGMCIMTDTLASQPECAQVIATSPVTNVSGQPPINNRGADGFPLNNFILPTAGGIGTLGTTAEDPGFSFGIVTGLGTDGTGADNTKVEVTWQGPILAKMAATVASPVWGKTLIPTTAGALTLTTAAGARNVARLEQDSTTANALAFVLFDGLNAVTQAQS